MTFSSILKILNNKNNHSNSNEPFHPKKIPKNNIIIHSHMIIIFISISQIQSKLPRNQNDPIPNSQIYPKKKQQKTTDWVYNLT